jgi:CubicO group peptidase (beta-lactamase class C family)
MLCEAGSRPTLTDFAATRIVDAALGQPQSMGCRHGQRRSGRLLRGGDHRGRRRNRKPARGPDLGAIGMTYPAPGLGFNLPTKTRPLGGPGSFGSVGLGGCRTWVLPEANLAFAYLPKHLLDANPDPRELALAAATLTSVGVRQCA